MRNYLFWRIFLIFSVVFISFLFIQWINISDSFLDQSFLDFYETYLILTIPIIAVISYFIAFYYVYPLKNIYNSLIQFQKNKKLGNLISRRKDEIGVLNNTLSEIFNHFQAEFLTLRTKQDLLEAILNNMNDGILIVDEAGKVQIINKTAAKMFNIKNINSIGSSLAETLQNYRVNEIWEACRQSGLQQSSSIETSTPHGYLHCIATPISKKSTASVLLLFQDITRIRQLEIIRRDFVSNVSHELRTPLASLKALTETLSEGALREPEIAKRFLQRMDVEIDNLTQLVQELLELSRIESGQLPLEKKWVDPQSIITKATERMQVQAERAGINYSTAIQKNLPMLKVDVIRLEQVLINLIHNAIKFTPPGGKIIVHAKTNDNNVVFAVEDTGVGIPAKDLERIFERFYKTDPSRSQHGTGLGLSISRHLVEAHGGSIWAESTLGKGSVFFFTIPQAA